MVTSQADIDQALDEVVADSLADIATTRQPGAAVLVTTADRSVYERAEGVIGGGDISQVTPETTFRLGSSSKSFTGAAVMRLVDQGMLALDTTLDELVPGFRRGHEITVRMLLSHRAGLSTKYPSAVGGTPPSGRQRVNDGDIAAWLHTRGPTSRLGRFVYSNAGYALLADLVRRVSGSSFDRFMADEVFGPLGMDASWMNVEPLNGIAVPTSNRAYGHVRDQGARTHVLGDGGVCSSLRDMGEWVRANLTHDPRLLSPASWRAMATPYEGGGSRYGLGWRVGSDGVFHHGLTAGFRSSVRVYPGYGFGVIVLRNAKTGSPSPAGLVSALARVVKARARFLRSGSEGPMVARLQTGLIAWELLSAPVTARFDDATKAAVRVLQARLGLKPDGVLGPRSAWAWNAECAEREAPQLRLCLVPELAGQT